MLLSESPQGQEFCLQSSVSGMVGHGVALVNHPGIAGRVFPYAPSLRHLPGLNWCARISSRWCITSCTTAPSTLETPDHHHAHVYRSTIPADTLPSVESGLEHLARHSGHPDTSSPRLISSCSPSAPSLVNESVPFSGFPKRVCA